MKRSLTNPRLRYRFNPWSYCQRLPVRQIWLQESHGLRSNTDDPPHFCAVLCAKHNRARSRPMPLWVSLQDWIGGRICMLTRMTRFPWGIFQTLSIAYASEVCPVILRGYLTTYVNICWVLGKQSQSFPEIFTFVDWLLWTGQILASGVLRGLLSNFTEWAYRIHCPSMGLPATPPDRGPLRA